MYFIFCFITRLYVDQKLLQELLDRFSSILDSLYLRQNSNVPKISFFFFKRVGVTFSETELWAPFDSLIS